MGKRAKGKFKRTVFAYAPFVRDLAFSAALHGRRLFRLPHQKHYAALRLIRDDPYDLYLDIGANHGQSVESIRLFKPNRVISFEANPLVGNALKARHPDTYAIALGKEAGEFKLYVPGYGRTLFEPWASLSRDVARRFLDTRPVHFFKRRHARIDEVVCEVRTLDSFKLAPALVKIDVEGMAGDVIEGGMETIREHLPIIMIEGLTADIESGLSPLGYRKFGYDGSRLVEGIRGKGDVFLIPDAKRPLLA